MKIRKLQRGERAMASTEKSQIMDRHHSPALRLRIARFPKAICTENLYFECFLRTPLFLSPGSRYLIVGDCNKLAIKVGRVWCNEWFRRFLAGQLKVSSGVSLLRIHRNTRRFNDDGDPKRRNISGLINYDTPKSKSHFNLPFFFVVLAKFLSNLVRHFRMIMWA